MSNGNYHQESKEGDSSESGNELTLLSGQGTESDQIHEVELVCGCGKSRVLYNSTRSFPKSRNSLSSSPLVLSFSLLHVTPRPTESKGDVGKDGEGQVAEVASTPE